MGGAAGTWSWDLGPLPRIRGSIYKKIFLQDPGSNTHTVATIRKEFLTPPPRKRGTQVRGGGGLRGSKSKKSMGDDFGPKMMILQGVRCQKPYVGVCHTNNPKKGGMYDACVCA